MLYRVNNTHKTIHPEKKCIVTGLDISMQKDNSRFLCTAGLRYYRKHHPEIWLNLWKRLSPHWHGRSDEIQFQEIHHSIRNEHLNMTHNTRRSIKKLMEVPSLFNQLELIQQDKLKIAGVA